MNNHYGYIKGTRGKDKDHIDVFLGDNIVTGKVYVVDQVNPDGSFDEHKVMLGFDSAQQAAAAYLSNYEPGWQGLGNITEVPVEQFKAWLGNNTAKTKPFTEYRNQSIEQVKQSVEQYSKKYGVPVEVVESSQQVQNPTARAAIRRVEQTGRGEVFGWFEPTTGKVQIYAPSVAFSLNELEKTILHEVVAHKGLRVLLGEEKFNALCDEVFDNMDDNVKLIYGAYVLGKPVNSLTQADRVAILNDKSLQREIDDELMASFAERGVNEHPSLWEKVKQLVREALKAIGVNINLTDADIAYLLYRSSKALQQNTILDRAKNIQQSRQVEANLSDKDTARQMGFETRLRSIGGNSGYVGYSMSKRAMQAKEDGRYPKSEFKKEYGVSEAALDIMVEADIINNNEWHHTSKFGNKTTFYGWADDVYEDVYRENKKEIDKICQNVVKLKPETENSSPEKLRQYVSAKKELISKLKDMFADAADKAERIAAEKYNKAMDNLHAYNEYRKANQVPVPERYIASNGVEVDTQQSRSMADWTAYNNGERLTKRYGKKLRDEAFYELNNNIRANDQNILPFEQWLNQEEQQVRSRTVSQINDKFNEDLQRQIDGTLPAGYVYQLGMPSDVLLSAGLPYLPIELASNRLADKSMQENHPFDLSELTGLVDAIQNPLAVFRSATHLESYVVLTEIQHKGKNYVVAIKTNKNKGRIRINSIRSVYPKNNNQVVNWINEGLLEYADKRRMPEWISKQQSNSADVRNLFRHAAKIVNDFENPTNIRFRYKTSQGKNVNFTQLSLFDNNQKDGQLLLGKKLRPLGSGEFSHIERRFTETGAFNFMGSETIESADDVAYIFSQLEDESIENAFAVLVKDKKPYVLHVGMGGFSSSMFNIPAIIAADNIINADAVYMVHNHPSGNLRASDADISILADLKNALGNKVQDGIIINLRTGKYGVFSSAGNKSVAVKADAANETPIKVYSFNKQVFEHDFTPDKLFQIRGSDDVASFISSYRLGDRGKIGILILNQQNKIVGNVFTQYTSMDNLNAEDAKNFAKEIIDYTLKMGGVTSIIFGSGVNLNSLDAQTNIRTVSSAVKRLSARNLSVTDWIAVDGNAQRYASAIDDGIRFRHTISQQDITPAEIFMSNAEYAVRNITQERAQPEQWLAMLQKNGGLKAAEDKWLGLSDWLKEQKGALSKQQLIDYIDKNRIRIEEVKYADNDLKNGPSSSEVESMLDRTKEDIDYYYKTLHNTEQNVRDAQNDYDAFIKEAEWLKSEYGKDSVEYRNHLFNDWQTEALRQAKMAYESAKTTLQYHRARAKELEKLLVETRQKENTGINPIRLEYVTPGLVNNHEIALTVPTIEPWNEDDKIHFGDAGGGRAIAWVRFGETTDKEGNRVLVIDEIQSKRHQEGRGKGYRVKGQTFNLGPEPQITIEDIALSTQDDGRIEARYGDIVGLYEQGTSDSFILYDLRSQIRNQRMDQAYRFEKLIPDAPFEKNWHELALKRMLHYAAKNRFDKLAWTTGEQQAARYDIDSKGMKGFYDKMLVDYMNKYGKKWGVHVEQVELPELGEAGLSMHSVDITKPMKESVLYTPQLMFRHDYTPEMEQIKERAITDGTFMKAPNGNPTNLNERQWLQTRTQSFKNWFGDWEKTARIEKLRRSEPVKVKWEDYKGLYNLDKSAAENYILNNLRGAYINKDTGSQIKISRSSAKVMHHDIENNVHLKSVAFIPQMIENAIFIEEKANEKNNKFDSYRYFVVGINIDGIDYTAKLVIGVKGADTYYDHALTQIEKNSLINQRDLVNAQVYDDKATLSGVKDKRLLSILQTNSSKVVDENGEPRVVYHGTPDTFFEFDPYKVGSNTGTADGRGFYFTTDKSYANGFGNRGSGNIIEAFLNIRKPLSYSKKTITKYQLKQILREADNVEFTAEGEHYLLSNYDNYTMVGIEKTIQKAVNIEYDYADNDVELVNSLIAASGNMPLIMDAVKKVTGKGSMIAPKDNGTTHYIVTAPSDIKSATENTGDFSAENNDIRFRHGVDEAYQNRLDTIDAYIDRYRKQGKQGVGRVTIKELKEKGLAGLLDKQEYNNLLREVLYTIPVLQQAAAVNRGETAEQIVANRIDYLCNNLADNGLQAATVIGLIRDALDSAGLSNDLTDEQLLYHLWKQTNQPIGDRTIKEQAVDRRRDTDIRFKIGRNTPPSTNTIDLSRGESFAEKFVDRMISVKLLQDEIKARGGRVPDEANPYITENLALSRSQREDQLYKDTIYKPLIEKVTEVEKLFIKLGLTDRKNAYKTVGDFLYARHAPERNKHICVEEVVDKLMKKISKSEMIFFKDEDVRKTMYALVSRIYNKVNGTGPDTSDKFAQNMLITKAKGAELQELLFLILLRTQYI